MPPKVIGPDVAHPIAWIFKLASHYSPKLQSFNPRSIDTFIREISGSNDIAAALNYINFKSQLLTATLNNFSDHSSAFSVTRR
jgi:hypothetical protein